MYVFLTRKVCMVARQRRKLHRDVDLILDNCKTFTTLTTSVVIVIKKSALYVRRRLRDIARQDKS